MRNNWKLNVPEVFGVALLIACVWPIQECSPPSGCVLYFQTGKAGLWCA